MNIIVPVKLVPDLVEELSIDENGTALDMTWVSLILNEFDDHALEEALQLKDELDANITVIALDSDETDKVLFTALAKGADRAIKLIGDLETGAPSHILANALTNATMNASMPSAASIPWRS